MATITINQQIAFLRKQNSLTQEELAQALGVTNQAVSKWESAQCCPDIALLPALAKLFNVSVDELIGYKGVDTSQNIVLQLRTLIDDLPHGEDFQCTLRLAYTLHAILFSKSMTTAANPGFDTVDAIEQASKAEWGLSFVNLPDITTYMRMGSVFFSNNKDLNLHNMQMRTIAALLHTFADVKNLKTMVAIYNLTVHAEDAYTSIAEVAQKSGLPEDTVRTCIENSIYAFLHEKYEADNALYRIEGMHMHIVPLLAMFSNIG